MKIKDITNEQFDEKLFELAREAGVDYILGLPGVYEIVSEEMNNEVLDALASADEA